MKLIVGLGNPGEKYENNRHNVGFMFVDYLVNKLTDSQENKFKEDKYTNSKLAKLVINNCEIIVVKPQTYMNESGIAVAKIFQNLKLEIGNFIVVHDDLDIPLGKIHIQVGVGPLLHNGLESIENHLHSKMFSRVRIGVDARDQNNFIAGESYVLHDFTPLEKNRLSQDIFPKIYSQLRLGFLRS